MWLESLNREKSNRVRKKKKRELVGFDTTTGNLHESLWRNQFPEFKQQSFMESCADAHCPLLEAAGRRQLLGKAKSVNNTSRESGQLWPSAKKRSADAVPGWDSASAHGWTHIWHIGMHSLYYNMT